MMTHLEGPIVDSVYDMALISWSKELNPPLPCSMTPATRNTLPDWQQSTSEKHTTLPCQSETTQQETNLINQLSNQSGNHDSNAPIPDFFRSLAKRIGNFQTVDLPEHTEKDPHYDPGIAAEVERSLHVLTPQGSERKIDAITRHLSKAQHLRRSLTSRLTYNRHYDPT